MVAIRGAICAQNTQQSIFDASAQLVSTILASNSIDIDTVTAIIFSTTADLDVANPATAVRKELGIENVALFSTQEMHVVGALTSCIRVLVLCDISLPKSQVVHCYLGEACVLRPDLKNN